MSGQKTVWVTGASSGLGLHTAMQLQKDGWRVIAGARSFEEGETDGMYRLKLDVTDEESVRRFCEKAAEIAPPDALVQCAGMLVLGSCEETETEEFRRVIDTNYLGMVRVNRSVLPIMRAQGHGKIVLFSSINGLLGIPFQGAYTASKHAIEGYSECLALEVKPFHVEVMLVEPGDHQSGSKLYRRHSRGMNDSSPYKAAFDTGTRVIAHDEENGLDPDALGEKIARTLKKKRLPRRLRIAKLDQRFAVILHDILPCPLFDRIIGGYYKKAK